MTTPVRVVCQNTLNAALAGQKQSYKVRHTSTAGGRIDQARLALGLTFKYLDEFESQAQALFATSVTDKQFMDIVTALYPEPADDAGKASVTKYETKIDLVKDLYFLSPTQEGIRGTAWGAYNALTERVDYFRQGRMVKGATNAQDNQLASASGFDVQANAEKNRILSAVKEVAGV
jgi:hypothetical protein